MATKITDESWDSQLKTDIYFDCKGEYTKDLIERHTNKEMTEITLAAIGNKQLFDIEEEGKNWSVLEIGCGYGLYAAHFCRFVKEYIGVDVSNYIVEKGNKALQEAQINNAKLFVIPSCDLSLLEDIYFDFIFTGAVFIHTPLEVTTSYIKQTHNKLNPNGKFLYHFHMDKNQSIHEPLRHFYTEDELDHIFDATNLKIIDVVDQKPSEDHPFYPDQWLRYVYGGINNE